MYKVDPYNDHSKPTKAQVDEIVAQTIKHFGKKLEEQSMNNTAATIQGQTFHYEGTLTITQIAEYRKTVLWMIRNDPDYLFLTEKAMLEIFGLQTYYMQRTCLGMHVVVLPTLPENTLIIGKFLLREEDPIQPLPTEEAIEKIQWLSEQCNNNRPEGLD